MSTDYNRRKDSFVVTAAQVIAVLFPVASAFIIISIVTSFHSEFAVSAYDSILIIFWGITVFFALCSCFINHPQVLRFGKMLAIVLTLCFVVGFLIGMFHELTGTFSELSGYWIFALLCVFYYLLIRYRIKRKNQLQNDTEKQDFEISNILEDRRKKKMLILIVSVFLLLILAFDVISRLRWPAEGEFQGTLTYAFEIKSFRPDYSIEGWWLADNGTFAETIYRDLAKRKVDWKTEMPHYRIKVYGKLSPIGKEGHYGMYRRSLSVEKIIEYEYIGNK